MVVLAVEASTAPGVLETEIPSMSNKPLHELFEKESTRPTIGGAGVGVDLIIPCAIVGYKPKTPRKPIDQFAVKSPRQLLSTQRGQLEFICVPRKILIQSNLYRFKGSHDSHDPVVQPGFAVGQELLSVAVVNMLKWNINTKVSPHIR